MGGIIFLVPIAIFIAVIGKGLEFTGAIARPVADALPVNMIGGVAVAHVLAILLLLLICFLAGLLARAAIARKAVDVLEANVLSRVPAYALLKTKTQSMLSPEDIEGMSPVIVRFDDSWQIAFELNAFRMGKSRSSYQARLMHGQAPSALWMRTASRPLICPLRPLPRWRSNLERAQKTCCAIASSRPSERPRNVH